MFNNLRKDVTTKEKYILKKMSLKFRKIAFDMYSLQNLNPFEIKIL